MIYLDSAATSFHKPPQVAEAVCRSFQYLGNAGRGAHEPTLSASRLIYDTREKLMQLFHGEDPSCFAFTSNVTEALNAAIGGLIQKGDHVITTAASHNSVLRPLYCKEAAGTCLTVLQVDSRGNSSLETMEASLRENTRAVVIGHGSNLTGNVENLAEISEMVHAHGAILIVDAAQTAGVLPIDVQKTGIDVLCFTGHKGLLGPQGTGGLYLRPDLEIRPFKTGGSGVQSFSREHPAVMPTVLEAGTLNGHGIAGLNAALDFLLETGVEEIGKKEDALARRFLERIQSVPGIRLYGDYAAPQRTPVVTINIGAMDSAEVSDLLWEEYGICVRSGAHCAPLLHQALGTADQGAVRFSFSCFNTEEEVDQAALAVREIAEEAEEPGTGEI